MHQALARLLVCLFGVLAVPAMAQTVSPTHAISRIGIVAMNYASVGLAGCALSIGDSLTEQARTTDYSNLIPLTINGAATNCSTGYPVAGTSPVFNGGIMGASCADLVSFTYQGTTYRPMDMMIGSLNPGRLSIQCGTNDAFPANNNAAFITAWKASFNALVGRASQQNGAIIVVQTIPPTSDGAHDNGLIAIMNAHIRSVPASYPWVRLLDLYAYSACSNGTAAPRWLLSDGVHLSGEGVWTRFWLLQQAFTTGIVTPPAPGC
jgi:lysophospholipase L1-like esterase